jgi:hypothetical protein
MSVDRDDEAESGAPTPHAHDHGRRHAALRFAAPGSEPVVLARRAELSFTRAPSADEATAAIIAFLDTLTEGLAAGGCVLVGHIKGVLAAPQAGALTFHLTTLTSAPHITGALAGRPSRATLSVNAIVFGVPAERLRGLVGAALASTLGAAVVWRD